MTNADAAHFVAGMQVCFGCNRLLGWYESRRTAVNEYVDQSQIQPTAAGENQ